jgi:glycosyltransferase involved in cell wall biosynthesis
LFREERRYLLGHLRDSGPDVVHAHWTYEFAWASLAGSANVLVTAHDAPLSVLRYSPDIYRAIRTGMAYYVRAGIQHLTVVSPYLAKQWRRQMAYRRDIRVIPNPIPDLRPAGEAADKGPIVLDIADASPRKNVQRLIQSFGQVRRVLPKAELRLVGPGLGPCDPMATWASKEELGTNVSFLGELDRPQVERQLDQAAVLCHPSLEEAQPMCLLEAMAKRVPIIGGRSSGGVPWTLQGGRCGVLVDVRSTDDLARNMLRLLRASKERESLAAAAFEFVYTRFAPEYIAQQYIESYRSILSA